MKKMTIALLLTVGFFGLTFAQHSVKFLPKVGVNYSYYNDNFDSEQIDGKTGYQVGFDLRFGEKVYFSPGIHYIEQKDKLVSVGGVVNVEPLDVEFRTKGLRVPLYLGGDLLANENFGIRVYTGVGMTTLLNQDDVFDSFDNWSQKDILWGVDAGVGLDFGFITIDLLHEWGLNDSIRYESVDAKNRTFMLSAGLMF